MILQALTKYYHRLAEEGEVAPEGFKHVEIPFLIILSPEGEFAGLQDTREKAGKKLVARSYLVPQERERPGPNAWQKSNLLWDHYGYVLGWPKSDSDNHKEMARKQHTTFMDEIKKLYLHYPNDKDIGAVCHFLVNNDFATVFEHPLWNECSKIPGCNLTFKISNSLNLVCESENVKNFVIKYTTLNSSDQNGDNIIKTESLCLITGIRSHIARIQPRTPIAGTKSNAKLVSFQKNMGFDSYGKLQGYNAPISKKTAFAYTTALNKMLDRNSRQKLFIGADTVVFWAEKQHDFEQVFVSLFGESPKGEPEQDYKSLLGLFRAPYTGVEPKLDPGTLFFVMGLAPNAARIAIRFWYTGSVREVAENMWNHFDDLEIVKGAKEWRSITLRSLLRSVALQEKDENIPPNLGGDIIRAVLAGTPYPQTLLSAAVRRCRAERAITYPHAALIKAVLTRDNRLGTRFCNKNEKEIGMSLDLDNVNIGYRLGRLFAVLEKVQEEASPGINATIRDRFYGSASATPVTAFAHLMKLKNHHLSKLENRGRAVNLEKIIGEIIDGIGDFPAHLSLADQGRFAVGYYHQRQAFFVK